MAWYYFIVGFVLCGVAIPFEHRETLRRNIQVLYFPLVILIVATFVGLRSSSPDYDNYFIWFNDIASGHLALQDWVKDPAFVFVCYFSSILGLSFIGVTIFFAVSTLVSQFYFSKLASDRRWVVLFFYLVVCRTLIGWDMASIRSAVATPLMSCGILLAFRGKKKIALFLYIVSLGFHVSALIGLLPFVLAMSNVRFCSRWWIVLLATATLFLKIYLGDIVVLLSYWSRTSPYVGTSIEVHGPPTAYLVYIAARLLLLAVILSFYWDKMEPELRLVFFCYSIGIFVQIVFIFNNALSWRGSDLFCLFDMYVLMSPLKYLKGSFRVSYVAGLVVLGLAFFYQAATVMEPYTWVLA